MSLASGAVNCLRNFGKSISSLWLSRKSGCENVPAGGGCGSTFEQLEPRLQLSGPVPETAVANLWGSHIQQSEFIRDVLSIGLQDLGHTWSAASDLLTETVEDALDMLSGAIDVDAAVTFSLGIQGEVNVGPSMFASAGVEAAELATGYNLTWDNSESEWTLSRAFEMKLVGLSAAAEFYAVFGDIRGTLGSDDRIRFGVKAALGGAAVASAEFQVSQLVQANVDFEMGASAQICVSVETELEVGDFLSNYVGQPSLVFGLADVFVPYFGDNPWQMIVDSIAQPVLGLDFLTDIGRSDTPIGLLAASAAHRNPVTVAVEQGWSLYSSGGVGFGLGADLFAGKADIGLRAGVTVALAGESDLIWSRTFNQDAGDQWQPKDTTPDDMTPPTISGLTVAPADYGTNPPTVLGTVTVSADVWDASGVGDVGLLVDGKLAGSMIHVGGDTYQGVWDTSSAGNRQRRIEVIAVDTNDNPGSEALTVVVVAAPPDNVPPSLQFLSPLQAEDFADEAYLVRWIDADPDDDARIDLYYYPADGSPADKRPVARGLHEQLEGGAGDSTPWITTAVPDGTYRLLAVLDDDYNDPVTVTSPGTVMVQHPIVTSFYDISQSRIEDDGAADDGRPNGVVQNGESASLRISITNTDGSDHELVRADLISKTTGVTIPNQGRVIYGTLASGETSDGDGDFDIVVTSDFAPYSTYRDAKFDLQIGYEDSGIAFDEHHEITVRIWHQDADPTPELEVVRVIYDGDDDGDGVLESGERTGFWVELRNIGNAACVNPMALIDQSTVWGSEVFSDRQTGYPDIAPNQTVMGRSDFDTYEAPLSFSGDVATSMTLWYGPDRDYSQSLSVPVSVAATPLMSVSPLTYNFGQVPSPQPIEHSFVLRNHGSAELTVTELTPSHADTSATNVTLPLTIAPGDSFEVAVQITTAEIQNEFITRTFTVHSNSHSNPQREIVVKGLVVDDLGGGHVYSRLWGVEPTQRPYTFSNIVTGDTDNDGNVEVIATSEGIRSNYVDYPGKIHIYEKTGHDDFQLVWESPGLGRIVNATALAVGNIDNDSFPDIVVVAGSNYLGGSHLPHRVMWYEASGDNAWTLRSTVFSDNSHRLCGVALGDTDGDGRSEVIVTRDAQSAPVKIFEWNGEAFSNTWTAPVLPDSDGGHDVEWASAVTVADSDSDGTPEVIVATAEGGLYALEHTGSNYALRLAYNSEDYLSMGDWDGPLDLAVADTDGDGRREIVCVSENRYLVIIESTGNNSWNTAGMEAYRLPNGAEGYAVTTGDTDADGEAEIIVGTSNWNQPVLVYDTVGDNAHALVWQATSAEVDDESLDVAVVNTNDTPAAEMLACEWKGFAALGTVASADVQIVSENIYIDPENPVENEPIVISAIVQNIGSGAAGQVAVRFFDGDPDSGGEQIGPDHLIDSIPAGESATPQQTWSASEAGPHSIFVTVHCAEDTELANNKASRSVQIDDDDIAGPAVFDVAAREHGGDDDGLLEDDEQIEFSWRAEDPSGISITTCNGSPATYDPASGRFLVVLGPFAAGDRQCVIMATDDDNSPAATGPVPHEFSVVFAAPEVILPTSPTSGEADVPLTPVVIARFNEPLAASSVNTSTVLLEDSSSAPVPGTVSYDARDYHIEFAPHANLSNWETYRVTLLSGATGIRDLNGNEMDDDYAWTFTTLADTLAPEATIDPSAISTHARGSVAVKGTAWDQNFLEYTVFVGAGANPSSWTPIGQSGEPVTGGELALWDTRDFPDGAHTIWLEVSDVALPTTHVSVDEIVIAVDNSAPTANLSHPLDGSDVALETINVRERYIDVTFADGGGSGPNAATVTDGAAEFVLTGDAAGGVTVDGAASPVMETTYRYSFAGNFTAGPVGVQFLDASWADLAGNGNVAEQETLDILPEANHAPTLTTVGVLTGAREDEDLLVLFEALANAADEEDADGDELSFRVESITEGTLQKDGVAVQPGDIFASGEIMVWRGTADDNGTRNAFAVTAWDGQDASSHAIQVPVDVSPVNDRPIASIDSIVPNPAQPPAQIVICSGSSEDVDGQVVAWRWTSNLDGVLGNVEVLTLSSNVLTVGRHNVAFQVQDEEGLWSDHTTVELVVADAAPTAEMAGVPVGPVEPSDPILLTLGGHDNDESQHQITSGELYLDDTLFAELTGTLDFLAPSAPGLHTLLYRVTDDEGSVDEVIETFEVVAVPTAISVTVSDPAGSEDYLFPGITDPIEFLVARNRTTDPLTVDFSLGGTAEFGEDYHVSVSGVLSRTVRSSGNVTFTLPAGDSPATVKISPYDDSESERTETVRLTLTPGDQYTIDPVHGQSEGTIADNDVQTLQVVSFAPTSTGFIAEFNREVDVDALNLYDGRGASLGAIDVTVAGDAGGIVLGSLVPGDAGRRVTFVATGGLLPGDRYTVTLRSAEDGFRDPLGELLDGDGNGSPGGDYTRTFSFASFSDRVLSIPDFARGPSQHVNLPATATGIPLMLSDGAGVLGTDFSLRYDPALLEIIGFSSDVPAWSSTFSFPAAGQMNITLFGTTELTAGSIQIGHIESRIPSSAPAGASAILQVEDIQLNEGSLAARGDTALQLVAYFGDVTGNGSYSGLDASCVARVAVGLDSGFTAFPITDPRVVGDITGNQAMSGFDASLVARKAVGLDVPEIPDLPNLLPTGPPARQVVVVVDKPLASVVEAAAVRTDAAVRQEVAAVPADIAVEIVALPGMQPDAAADDLAPTNLRAARDVWFVDSTQRQRLVFALPNDARRRTVSAVDPADGRMGLVTAVMHKLADPLEYESDEARVTRATLPLGARRFWDDLFLLLDDELGAMVRAGAVTSGAVDAVFGAMSSHATE